MRHCSERRKHPQVVRFANQMESYIECVDILYSTNRFHISSMPLILHLPRLLPARAASDIQSVELCWELGQVAQPPVTDQDISSEPRFHGWRMFLSLLDQLPRSLPHLRYLHLTLRGIWFPPQMAVNDLVRHSEPAMLQPIDEMVRELYRTSGWSSPRYIVAIPTNIFRAKLTLDVHDSEDGPELDLEEAPGNPSLIWRSLGPQSPGQSEVVNNPGYWLDNALDDAPSFREQLEGSLFRVERIPLPNIALAGDW